jgi:16S rRNA processing protein RimM
VNDLLEFGYVARAHGLKGEVAVHTHDPASEVFSQVDRVVCRPRSGGEKTLEIDDAREGPKGDVLVFFKGVRTREAAEALVGATLLAHRDELDEPEEGEFFQGDLVGLTAKSPEGETLGTVKELAETGPVPNLVITGGPRGELMIPFAEDFVVEVKLDEKLIVVKPFEMESESEP